MDNILTTKDTAEIYDIAEALRLAIIDKLAEKENQFYLDQLKLLERYIAYKEPNKILKVIDNMQKYKINMMNLKEDKKILEGYDVK